MNNAVEELPGTTAAQFVNSTSPSAKMEIVADFRRVLSTKQSRRCRVPSDLVVTPVVIVGLAKRMPTQALEDIIEHLIREIDNRAGDPDSEQEQDGCVDDFSLAPASDQRQSRIARIETVTLPIIKLQGASKLLAVTSSS